MAERLFGRVITNSDGREVPVRYIGEQHVQEDLGRIPTLSDWLLKIQPESWMLGPGRSIEKEIDVDTAAKKQPKRSR
jgi:hypothetical protein